MSASNNVKGWQEILAGESSRCLWWLDLCSLKQLVDIDPTYIFYLNCRVSEHKVELSAHSTCLIIGWTFNKFADQINQHNTYAQCFRIFMLSIKNSITSGYRRVHKLAELLSTSLEQSVYLFVVSDASYTSSHVRSPSARIPQGA